MTKQIEKLSITQIRALEDVERCGDPAARVFGCSRSGGFAGTMRVLEHRRKLIRHDGDRFVLTTEGRTALDEYRRRSR